MKEKKEKVAWLKQYNDTYFESLGVFYLNSLPKDKISDHSKFKAFADDKINVTQKTDCGKRQKC